MLGSQKRKEQVFRFDYAVGILLKYLHGLYFQHPEGLEYPAPFPDTDDLPGNEDIRLLEKHLSPQRPFFKYY